MNKKYVVRLRGEEHSMLEQLVSKGMTQAYRIKHANILLAVDADGPGWSAGTTALLMDRRPRHSAATRTQPEPPLWYLHGRAAHAAHQRNAHDHPGRAG
ncbi:MAG: hypothetical protein QGD90_03560, partial [Candidatus Hydrogenedentes bacterium]|nr:hypothetical protein [Candidatus Hydrogenedentota bacterium]